MLDEARGEVALLGRALEAYPTDFVKIRAALFSVSGESARPHFDTREKALRSVYRTLAAVDYTLAQDLPAKCAPEERRAAILRKDNGLLAGPDGKLTPWFAAVLGLERAGVAPEHITAAASVTDRAKALAQIEQLTSALSGDDLEPAARAEALCERAGLYDSLAVTSTGEAVEASAPIEAGFSVPPVHGSCAAFCDGPPRPSYGGGGGSSGYSTTWGPVLGQAIGNLIGQGIRKLFEPRPQRALPQGSYARTVPREQSTSTSEPPPPPPEPQLEPDGLIVTVHPSPAQEGAAINVTAIVSFQGKRGSKAGIPVRVTLDHEDRLEFISAHSANTNGEGVASFLVRAKPEVEKLKIERVLVRSDRAQDALDAERRRSEDAQDFEPEEHSRLRRSEEVLRRQLPRPWRSEMKSFLTNEQLKRIRTGEPDLRAKLTRLIEPRLPKAEADYYGILLSELWALSTKIQLRIENLATQKELAFKEDDDFCTEMFTDLTTLKATIDDRREAIQALAVAGK